MGFRFYRRLKVFPGLTLNVSRRGVSASVGVKGAHITVGHGRVRETVGIPGSGLSFTHVDKTHADGPGAAHQQAVTETLPNGRAWKGWLWIAVLLALIAMFATYVIPK
jgi:hypothetical protein